MPRLIYSGQPIRPKSISKQKALELEAEIYAQLMQEKERCREAETRYWQWFEEDESADIPPDLHEDYYERRLFND